MNQCDGCMSKQKLRGDLHIDEQGRATMVCQADRYMPHLSLREREIYEALKIAAQFMPTEPEVPNYSYPKLVKAEVELVQGVIKRYE